MKSPLRKRLLPELKSQAGKYAVIAVMIIFSVSLLSGYDIGGGALADTYYDSLERYNVENGNFETTNKAGRARIKSIEKNGSVTIYEDFYSQQTTDNGKILRIFGDRDEVNMTYLISGRMPQAAGEIAVDGTFAKNNSLSVGDTLVSGKRQWVITGLIAMPDYSSMFESNSDSMFDAITFTVACVSDTEFASYSDDEITWRYAWKYNEGAPADDAAEKVRSDDLLDIITDNVKLESYTPRYFNQAIMYFINDNQGDRAMIIVLLYIIIGIMAFISGITTADTISRESAVIGTLRAMGYTRRELIFHYMSVPVVVTLLSGVIGNVVGYGFMTDWIIDIYSASYSLIPPTVTFDAATLVKTTVVPAMVMFAINYIVLSRKLRISPLRFLRHDIEKKQKGNGLKLSRKIPFLTRFSIRVITSNMLSYVLIFAGIVFANVCLLFGMGLPEIIDKYASMVSESMLAEHIYTLSVPLSAVDEDKKLESTLFMISFQQEVQTDTEGAEKFSAYSLECQDAMKDECTLYGVEDNSRYIDIDMKKGDVYVSSALSAKLKVGVGDIVTLKEKYEEKTYSFRISGVYDYDAGICMYMPIDDLNDYFDLGDGYFCGYFSDNEITDIDEKYIGSDTDYNSLTKLTRQLMVSMGSMMKMVNVLAEVIFAAIVYLLSKIIIEKNAVSISMAKVLGYSSGEVSKLYIMPTTVATVISLALSVPICDKLMQWMFEYYITDEMAGYIKYMVSSETLIKMFVFGLLTYIAVALLEYRKVRKIPMGDALKTVE